MASSLLDLLQRAVALEKQSSSIADIAATISSRASETPEDLQDSATTTAFVRQLSTDNRHQDAIHSETPLFVVCARALSIAYATTQHPLDVVQGYVHDAVNAARWSTQLDAQGLVLCARAALRAAAAHLGPNGVVEWSPPALRAIEAGHRPGIRPPTSVYREKLPGSAVVGGSTTILIRDALAPPQAAGGSRVPASGGQHAAAGQQALAHGHDVAMDGQDPAASTHGSASGLAATRDQLRSWTCAAVATRLGQLHATFVESAQAASTVQDRPEAVGASTFERVMAGRNAESARAEAMACTRSTFGLLRDCLSWPEARQVIFTHLQPFLTLDSIIGSGTGGAGTGASSWGGGTGAGVLPTRDRDRDGGLGHGSGAGGLSSAGMATGDVDGRFLPHVEARVLLVDAAVVEASVAWERLQLAGPGSDRPEHVSTTGQSATGEAGTGVQVPASPAPPIATCEAVVRALLALKPRPAAAPAVVTAIAVLAGVDHSLRVAAIAHALRGMLSAGDPPDTIPGKGPLSSAEYARGGGIAGTIAGQASAAGATGAGAGSTAGPTSIAGQPANLPKILGASGGTAPLAASKAKAAAAAGSAPLKSWTYVYHAMLLRALLSPPVNGPSDAAHKEPGAAEPTGTDNGSNATNGASSSLSPSTGNSADGPPLDPGVIIGQLLAPALSSRARQVKDASIRVTEDCIHLPPPPPKSVPKPAGLSGRRQAKRPRVSGGATEQVYGPENGAGTELGGHTTSADGAAEAPQAAPAATGPRVRFAEPEGPESAPGPVGATAAADVDMGNHIGVAAHDIDEQDGSAGDGPLDKYVAFFGPLKVKEPLAMAFEIELPGPGPGPGPGPSTAAGSGTTAPSPSSASTDAAADHPFALFSHVHPGTLLAHVLTALNLDVGGPDSPASLAAAAAASGPAAGNAAGVASGAAGSGPANIFDVSVAPTAPSQSHSHGHGHGHGPSDRKGPVILADSVGLTVGSGHSLNAGALVGAAGSRPGAAGSAATSGTAGHGVLSSSSSSSAYQSHVPQEVWRDPWLQGKLREAKDNAARWEEGASFGSAISAAAGEASATAGAGFTASSSSEEANDASSVAAENTTTGGSVKGGLPVGHGGSRAGGIGKASGTRGASTSATGTGPQKPPTRAAQLMLHVQDPRSAKGTGAVVASSTAPAQPTAHAPSSASPPPALPLCTAAVTIDPSLLCTTILRQCDVTSGLVLFDPQPHDGSSPSGSDGALLAQSTRTGAAASKAVVDDDSNDDGPCSGLDVRRPDQLTVRDAGLHGRVHVLQSVAAICSFVHQLLDLSDNDENSVKLLLVVKKQELALQQAAEAAAAAAAERSRVQAEAQAKQQAAQAAAAAAALAAAPKAPTAPAPAAPAATAPPPAPPMAPPELLDTTMDAGANVLQAAGSEGIGGSQSSQLPTPTAQSGNGVALTTPPSTVGQSSAASGVAPGASARPLGGLGSGLGSGLSSGLGSGLGGGLGKPGTVLGSGLGGTGLSAARMGGLGGGSLASSTGAGLQVGLGGGLGSAGAKPITGLGSGLGSSLGGGLGGGLGSGLSSGLSGGLGAGLKRTLGAISASGPGPAGSPLTHAASQAVTSPTDAQPQPHVPYVAPAPVAKRPRLGSDASDAGSDVASSAAASSSAAAESAGTGPSASVVSSTGGALGSFGARFAAAASGGPSRTTAGASSAEPSAAGGRTGGQRHANDNDDDEDKSSSSGSDSDTGDSGDGGLGGSMFLSASLMPDLSEKAAAIARARGQKVEVVQPRAGCMPAVVNIGPAGSVGSAGTGAITGAGTSISRHLPAGSEFVNASGGTAGGLAGADGHGATGAGAGTMGRGLLFVYGPCTPASRHAAASAASAAAQALFQRAVESVSGPLRTRDRALLLAAARLMGRDPSWWEREYYGQPALEDGHEHINGSAASTNHAATGNGTSGRGMWPPSALLPMDQIEARELCGEFLGRLSTLTQTDKQAQKQQEKARRAAARAEARDKRRADKAAAKAAAREESRKARQAEKEARDAEKAAAAAAAEVERRERLRAIGLDSDEDDDSEAKAANPEEAPEEQPGGDGAGNELGQTTEQGLADMATAAAGEASAMLEIPYASAAAATGASRASGRNRRVSGKAATAAADNAAVAAADAETSTAPTVMTDGGAADSSAALATGAKQAKRRGGSGKTSAGPAPAAASSAGSDASAQAPAHMPTALQPLQPLHGLAAPALQSLALPSLSGLAGLAALGSSASTTGGFQGLALPPLLPAMGAVSLPLPSLSSLPSVLPLSTATAQGADDASDSEGDQSDASSESSGDSGSDSGGESDDDEVEDAELAALEGAMDRDEDQDADDGGGGSDDEGPRKSAAVKKPRAPRGKGRAAAAGGKRKRAASMDHDEEETGPEGEMGTDEHGGEDAAAGADGSAAAAERPSKWKRQMARTAEQTAAYKAQMAQWKVDRAERRVRAKIYLQWLRDAALSKRWWKAARTPYVRFVRLKFAGPKAAGDATATATASVSMAADVDAGSTAVTQASDRQPLPVGAWQLLPRPVLAGSVGKSWRRNRKGALVPVGSGAAGSGPAGEATTAADDEMGQGQGSTAAAAAAETAADGHDNGAGDNAAADAQQELTGPDALAGPEVKPGTVVEMNTEHARHWRMPFPHPLRPLPAEGITVPALTIQTFLKPVVDSVRSVVERLKPKPLLLSVPMPGHGLSNGHGHGHV